jgi:hypothetical protein
VSPNGGVVFDAAGNLYSSVSEFDQTYESAVFELVRSSKGWTEKTIYILVVSSPAIWLSTPPAICTVLHRRMEPSLASFS